MTVLFGILTLVTGDPMWIQVKVTIFNVMFALFLFVGLIIGKNFFQHIFEGTFHYTKEGWDKFTWSFAWFFVLTAVLNEVVRQYFQKDGMYPPIGSSLHDILGFQIDGVNVWILFKIAFIMPLSGLYAWYLTTLMAKYRVPQGGEGGLAAPQSEAGEEARWRSICRCGGSRRHRQESQGLGRDRSGCKAWQRTLYANLLRLAAALQGNKFYERTWRETHHGQGSGG